MNNKSIYYCNPVVSCCVHSPRALCGIYFCSDCCEGSVKTTLSLSKDAVAHEALPQIHTIHGQVCCNHYGKIFCRVEFLWKFKSSHLDCFEAKNPCWECATPTHFN